MKHSFQVSKKSTVSFSKIYSLFSLISTLEKEVRTMQSMPLTKMEENLVSNSVNLKGFNQKLCFQQKKLF